MSTAIFRMLRFASIAICLIVVASFAVFAVQQTKEGSLHQQEELGSVQRTARTTSPGSKSTGSSGHEGSVHKALTETSNKLTSPFAGIVSSSSEWVTRSVKMLFALVVYGFGLGYVARVLRVRI